MKTLKLFTDTEDEPEELEEPEELPGGKPGGRPIVSQASQARRPAADPVAPTPAKARPAVGRSGRAAAREARPAVGNSGRLPARIADPLALKVLSVHQPWCDLILSGAKPVENRSWKTSYRGRIFIHASKLEARPNQSAVAAHHADDDFAEIVCNLWNEPGSREIGAIIGSVELVDIVPFDLFDAIGEQVYAEKRRNKPDRFRADFCRDFKVSAESFDRAWEIVATTEERRLFALVSGPECWLLDNPIRLKKPIRTGGKLNLWNFQADRLPE